ncbi:MAG: hypothetical protein QF809_02660 [Candidatus Peribacteraceae bacterium]|jgi:hypothetical protein|nr:hypothetical protein [Candidatus Peribacteraceae bacterium]
MAKRPTPKKRRAKSKGRNQQSVYEASQIKKITNRRNSPYSRVAEPKNKEKKALKGVTRIKA